MTAFHYNWLRGELIAGAYCLMSAVRRNRQLLINTFASNHRRFVMTRISTYKLVSALIAHQAIRFVKYWLVISILLWIQASLNIILETPWKQLNKLTNFIYNKRISYDYWAVPTT